MLVEGTADFFDCLLQDLVLLDDLLIADGAQEAAGPDVAAALSEAVHGVADGFVKFHSRGGRVTPVIGIDLMWDAVL